MSNVYALNARTIDGDDQSLSEYAGKTLLVVNVASKCGFTPQYTGLEAMYRKYKSQGLVVLGFPCDQFGHQEPGNADEIKNFCATKYDVSFPLFAKIEVNGAHTHPIYKLLKQSARGIFGSEGVKWNFTKFLIDKHGTIVRRYAPTDSPATIESDIAKLL